MPRNATRTLNQGDEARTISLHHLNPRGIRANRPDKYKSHQKEHRSLIPDGYESHVVGLSAGAHSKKQEWSCPVYFCLVTFAGKASMVRHIKNVHAEEIQVFMNSEYGWWIIENKEQAKAQPTPLPSTPCPVRDTVAESLDCSHPPGTTTFTPHHNPRTPSGYTVNLLSKISSSKVAPATPYKWTVTRVGADKTGAAVYTTIPAWSVSHDKCDRYIYHYKRHTIVIDVPCTEHKVLPGVIDQIYDDHCTETRLPVDEELCPFFTRHRTVRQAGTRSDHVAIPQYDGSTTQATSVKPYSKWQILCHEAFQSQNHNHSGKSVDQPFKNNATQTITQRSLSPVPGSKSLGLQVSTQSFQRTLHDVVNSYDNSAHRNPSYILVTEIKSAAGQEKSLLEDEIDGDDEDALYIRRVDSLKGVLSNKDDEVITLTPNEPECEYNPPLDQVDGQQGDGQDDKHKAAPDHDQEDQSGSCQMGGPANQQGDQPAEEQETEETDDNKENKESRKKEGLNLPLFETHVTIYYTSVDTGEAIKETVPGLLNPHMTISTISRTFLSDRSLDHLVEDFEMVIVTGLPRYAPTRPRFMHLREGVLLDCDVHDSYGNFMPDKVKLYSTDDIEMKAWGGGQEAVVMLGYEWCQGYEFRVDIEKKVWKADERYKAGMDEGIALKLYEPEGIGHPPPESLPEDAHDKCEEQAPAQPPAPPKPRTPLPSHRPQQTMEQTRQPTTKTKRRHTALQIARLGKACTNCERHGPKSHYGGPTGHTLCYKCYEEWRRLEKPATWGSMKVEGLDGRPVRPAEKRKASATDLDVEEGAPAMPPAKKAKAQEEKEGDETADAQIQAEAEAASRRTEGENSSALSEAPATDSGRTADDEAEAFLYGYRSFPAGT